MRFRISIRGLVALILLVGFGLAALRGASLGWATASILLAVVALATATLGAIVGRGTGRASWIGFAVFGWIYFLLHFGPAAEWKKGYGVAHFTTWTIDELVLPRIAPELAEGLSIGGEEEFIRLRSGQSGSFVWTSSHALISILLGLLGAAIAPVLAPQAEAKEPDRPG
jgi:hypothetical protein